MHPETPGATSWLGKALGLVEPQEPFPWQEALLGRLLKRTVDGRSQIPTALDIPTGLGKTAVIAIWLVARALGATLPRRLAYVVDRRAVVDQATTVALRLREFVGQNTEIRHALGMAERQLPISTLRGQYIDNREWLEDPAAPAIIVGTVDMIGSRLLFEGYGVSRKMRPYQAGLLGADTLLVLDESHLVQPFERLIETIADGGEAFGPRDAALRKLVPPFHLLTLSATGRTDGDKVFGLTEEDLRPGSVPRKRLDASKKLRIVDPESSSKLAEALAKQAWMLASEGEAPVKVIVYCNSRNDAQESHDHLRKIAHGAKIDPPTQLFVGGRRALERLELEGWLKEHGFLAGNTTSREAPAFVFSTSAGEVGVDLDADHVVCDLVAWERMIQRFGRVNRRGDGSAEVRVMRAGPSGSTQKILDKAPSKRTLEDHLVLERHERLKKSAEALQRLPGSGEDRDASPGAIRELRLRADSDQQLREILDAATTPPPLRPALTRALVDAWSMTSLEQHTGRPKVEPWLRGWVDDELQSGVAWRTFLPVREGEPVAPKEEIEAYFEAAPPHASEILETETFRVIDWLVARAASAGAERNADSLRTSDIAAIVLSPAGDLVCWFTLRELIRLGVDKKTKDRAVRTLSGAMVIVDARLGGLSSGLLDARRKEKPEKTIDAGESHDGWLPSVNGAPAIRFRVRPVSAVSPASVDDEWRERHRFAKKFSAEGEALEWLVVEKWRDSAATEDDRAAGRLQHLKDHQDRVAICATEFADRLRLTESHPEYVKALAVAAKLHDEGKRSARWQQAFNAPAGGPYAKTPGPFLRRRLDGYRHELGSLLRAAECSELAELSLEARDLALHLIIAHHGFGRPVIRIDGCEAAAPSQLTEQARGIALRFARLQKRWGPWGLAWWEALLRAADQQASRENDQPKNEAKEEVA